MVIVIWIVMAIIVCVVALNRGRNGFGWFVYGLLIWPVALINVLVIPPLNERVETRAIEAGDSKRCPHCAEIIRAQANVCRYCGRDVPVENPDALRAPARLPARERPRYGLAAGIVVLFVLGVGIYIVARHGPGAFGIL